MEPGLDVRRFRAERPPAMLLGGLNVGRALGLAGIPVIIAASHAHEPALASRYCAGRLRLPPPDDARAMVDALLRAGERLTAALGRRVPLFYSNDDRQRLVQCYRGELAQHYELLLNDAEVADALIEKDLFQPLAARRGLPVPAVLEWQALDAVRHPVLVKPRTKFAWDASPVHVQLFGRRGKARIYASGPALLADPRARQLKRDLLVQEYVEGDDRDIWSFHGFADEQSRVLDWFIGRKLRTHPPLTGSSTFLELARDEELEALGQQLVAAVPLKGVFKIDLKRDPRSGQFRVLEVNARYNLWHYLGAANGVNLPRVAYRYLLYRERPEASGRYRTTHRWIYLRYDWRAYRELASRGELRFTSWIASLVRRPTVCSLFSLRDPSPFFHRLYHWTRVRVPRVPAMVRRWLFTAS